MLHFIFALIVAQLTVAQSWRQPSGVAGQFDLYVLSLSWSPAFCASKDPNHPVSGGQCSQRLGFVIHGLWPQAKAGQNPQFCSTPHRMNRNDVSGALNGKLQMPDNPKLWEHEWTKHGACSGLSAKEYFDYAGLAANRVNLPNVFENVNAPIRESAQRIEEMFISANPGLSADKIEVKVDRNGNIYEVVICMNQQLAYVKCENVRQTPPGSQGILLPMSSAAPAQPVKSAEALR